MYTFQIYKIIGKHEETVHRYKDCHLTLAVKQQKDTKL